MACPDRPTETVNRVIAINSQKSSNRGALFRGRLAIGAVSNWAALAVTVLSGLVITPLVIERLGTEAYGVWSLAASFIGYYGLFEVGVRAAITRFIGYHDARGELEQRNSVLSTSFWMFILLGAIVAAFCIATAPAFSNYFDVSAPNRPVFIEVFRLIGVLVAVTFISNVAGALLTAFEDFFAISVIGAGTELLRFISILLLLNAGLGVVALAYGTMAATLIRTALAWVVAYRRVPGLTISFRLFSPKTVWALLSFAIFVFASGAGDQLRHQVDTVVVGRAISVDAVGVYAVALLIVRYSIRVGSSAVAVLVPRFSRVWGAGDTDEFRTVYRMGSNSMAIVGWGLGLVGVACGPVFVELWISPGFPLPDLVLYLLLLSAVIDISTSASVYALQAMKKHRVYAALNLIEGATNLLLSIVLAPRLGFIGVALGTMIPTVVMRVVVQPVYSSRVIGVGLPAYLKLTLLRPGSVAVAVGFGALLVQRWVSIATFGNLTIYVLCLGTVYLAFASVFGSSDELRRKIRGKAREVFKQKRRSGKKAD